VGALNGLGMPRANESGLSPIDMARSSGIPDTSEVVKHMNVEEIVRLVILRTKYRAQNK